MKKKTFYLYDERFETDEEVKQRLENAKKERNLAKQEAARKRKETLEKKKKEQDLEYVTYLKLKEKFENK